MSRRRDAWIDRARTYVGGLTRDLPAEMSLAQRRKHLRQHGWQFHQGTFWGRRKYGVACREYLERHGQQPRLRRGVEAHPNFGPDIVFPFRAPANG